MSLAQSRGVPVARLGVVGGDAVDVEGQFSIPVDELRTAWAGTLPALFGPSVG